MTSQNDVEFGEPEVPGDPLDVLDSLDQIGLAPDVDAITKTTNPIDLRGRFIVKDFYGNYLYTALEETDIWMKLCCRTCRSFNIVLRDCQGQVAMTTRYNHTCSLFPLPIWRRYDKNGDQSVAVTSSGGTILGHVIKRIGYHTRFDITNPHHDVIAHATSTDCAWQCCWLPREYTFEILNADHCSVGSIVRRYSETDNGVASYSIVFPPESSVSFKATLIGAVFFINFVLFEQYDIFEVS